jgi:hypothetical protein
MEQSDLAQMSGHLPQHSQQVNEECVSPDLLASENHLSHCHSRKEHGPSASEFRVVYLWRQGLGPAEDFVSEGTITITTQVRSALA